MVDINVGYIFGMSQFFLDKISNVDLTKSVDEFKDLVSEKVNRPKNEFDVFHCGSILEGNTTLVDLGIRDNSILHISTKLIDTCKTTPEYPEREIKDLLPAFRIVSSKAILKRILLKMNDPEVMANLIKSIPGMMDNTVAMTILRSPELLSKMGGSIEAVTKIAKEQPAVAFAIRSLVAVVANDFVNSPPSRSLQTSHSSPSLSLQMSNSSPSVSLQRSNPSRIPNISSFFPMSEDDEDESDSQFEGSNFRNDRLQSPENGSGRSSPRNVAVVNTIPSSSQLRVESASGVGAPPRYPQQRNEITAEMLTQAVQQALGSTSGTNQSHLSDQQSGPSTLSADRPNQVIASNVQELRNLGFIDDTRNFNALQLSNGNLEEAIHILLSGALDD